MGKQVTITQNTLWMVFTAIITTAFVLGCVPLTLSILTYNNVMLNPLPYSSHAYVGTTFAVWVGGYCFALCVLYVTTVIEEGTGLIETSYETRS